MTNDLLKMKVHEDELLFIYNSNDLQDRESFGYASSAYGNKIKPIDLTKDSLTERQIKEIADRLGTNPEELINKNSDVFKREYGEISTDQEDVLKILKQRPVIMKTPIAIYADKADFVHTAYEFVPGTK